MNKRGQVGFFIVFLILAFTIILIGGIAGPIGARFSTEIFAVGEDIMIETQQDVLPNINDADIRNGLNASFNAAIDSGTANIEVSTALYEYAWIVLLVLTAIVIFLITRKSIPYQGVV